MEALAEQVEESRQTLLHRKLSLECSACGYGIARPTPPERCPMCQAVETWAHTPWRPFSRARRPC